MAKESIENIEIVLYKCIGVLLFKNIVLKCESILHRRRGYYLVNYHPESLTAKGVKDFKWMLLYNCLLHLSSTFFSILYLILSHVAEKDIMLMDISMVVVIFFNVYCVLLQRYNYLKIRELSLKLQNKVAKQVAKQIKIIDEMDFVSISADKYNKQISLLANVEKVYVGINSFVITEDDVEVLEQLKNIYDLFGVRNLSYGIFELPLDVSIDGGIKDFNPCQRVKLIVDIMKHISNRNMRGNRKMECVLVVQSERCEELFRNIFADGPAEIMLSRVNILQHILTYKVRAVS